jgi:hypothetical protein
MGGALSNTVRSYPYSYTVSLANTWEYKTVTIAGDTSGTWNTTNGIGIVVYFNIGCGSTYLNTAGTWVTAEEFGPTGQVNVISTLNSTWQLTGVQLEVGSSATGFEYVNYQTSLANCQRYCLVYRQSDSAQMGNGVSQLNTTNAFIYHSFPVSTRVAPTGISVTSVANFIGNGTNTNLTISSITFANASTTLGRVTLTGTGGTSSQPIFLQGQNSSAVLEYTGMEL